jgi:hypothetical protein
MLSAMKNSDGGDVRFTYAVDGTGRYVCADWLRGFFASEFDKLSQPIDTITLTPNDF